MKGTTERGYGAAHQAERRRWEPTVLSGNANCARCHKPIDPRGPWDLGHNEDRTQWTGPEHQSCNRAAGARNSTATRLAPAKNVGSSVPADFDKVGAVVADLNTRLGLSGATLETVASQYLEAGRILGEDVDITKTSAAFSAFKIEGDDVVGAMDQLFQVSQATGVGMNELAESAARNAPAMQTLGFSFAETTAMVGSFDKAGLNSSAIMASMSKGMVTLAKDGEQPAEAFKRVQGEISGFIASGDRASALDLASKVFGTKGAPQFVAALESGALNLDDMSKAAGQTGDSILGVGAETMDFAEQWHRGQYRLLLGRRVPRKRCLACDSATPPTRTLVRFTWRVTG